MLCRGIRLCDRRLIRNNADRNSNCIASFVRNSAKSKNVDVRVHEYGECVHLPPMLKRVFREKEKIVSERFRAKFNDVSKNSTKPFLNPFGLATRATHSVKRIADTSSMAYDGS